MKYIGFIGGYDKLNLIIHIAKMIEITNKRVLIVDSTIEQKSKYTIPAINPTLSYVTNYENMDIATGFYDFEEIMRYLGIRQLEYDYILVDCDNMDAFEGFKLSQAYKNYFVTSLSVFSVRKGLNILANIKQPIKLTKVIFSKELSEIDSEYLDYLSLGYKISWDDYKVFFPFESGDETAMIENEKLNRIRYKNLSEQYRTSLQYIAEEILGDEEVPVLMRALKNYDKGE